MKKLLHFSLLLISLQAGAQVTVNMRIRDDDSSHTISRHIYGHFAEHLGRCIYDGFWVNDSMEVPRKDRIRLDIVEALKKIRIPNLRWPGGCFADEYHWRDGIGPRKDRPSMVNSNWGGITEDNSFGTHEFLELCDLLGCDPYIAANVGSGTVEEMSKWVEYLNYEGESPLTRLRRENGRDKPWKVSYWGVGNESWGCGGNMTADFYADQYKRYATYARDYGDAKLKRIASGSTGADYDWTEVLMKKARGLMWGLTLHYYTLPTGSWKKKGSATVFDEKEYFSTMKNCLLMDELLSRHSTIMDRYDPAKKVALVVDEWGIWTDPEEGTNPAFLYQQNSLRDALVAATTLNMFNNHSDRVRMANLAQTVNVLQALVLTKGKQILLTPTYHVFDLFKVHHDARWLPVSFKSPDYVLGDQKIPALNASASRDSSGTVHITMVNLDPNRKITVKTAFNNISWKQVSGEILSSEKLSAINSFDQPNHVQVEKFTGARKKAEMLEVELPAKSIVMLELR